jgi:beta-lactamase class A
MKTSRVAELQGLINAGRGVEVSLAAYHVPSGEEILINPDRTYHAASTMKICVMMEVFRQSRERVFSLEDEITIKNEFASLADKSLYALSIEDDSEKDLYGCLGQTIPIRELVQRMITASSNLATNLLVERVGAEGTTAFMRALGAEGLHVRRGVEDPKAFKRGLNNEANARGLMQILLKLARREVVSRKDSDEMIDILAHQQFNEMIPALLPTDVRVAHKTGWTGKFYHDAGIIYPPDAGPYILVILTNGFESDNAAFPFIATLAKKVYGCWQKPAPPLKVAIDS